jgi:hypothetical protein
MSNEQIAEGNKLIAEFMNWVHSQDPATDAYEMERLKFHTSWDWLMPVVEKIGENYTINLHLFPGSDFTATFKEGNFRRGNGESPRPIEATWLAVVQHIQWYN